MRSRLGEGVGIYLQTAQLAGITGLSLFAFSCLLSTSEANIGLALLVGATILRPPPLQRLRREPLVALAAVSTINLIVRTIWAIWELPQTVHLQVSQAWDWFRLWLFVLVAWWLKEDCRRIRWVLLLSLVSLLVGMVFMWILLEEAARPPPD